jgi:hypothetical protein
MNQMTLLASECHDCRSNLDARGRNRITMPISQRIIEVCDRCAKSMEAGLEGEIQTDDGAIYKYLYLPHSQVTCFYPLDNDKKGFDGFYDNGPCHTSGFTPYPHLEELCEKWVKLCPDAQERARKFHKEANT